MRWKDLRRSSNVRDVRGAGGGGGMRMGGPRIGGGLGVLVIVVLAFVLGGPEAVLQLLGGGGAGAPSGDQGRPLTTNDAESDFVARVLGSTEDVWQQIFRAAGKQYEEPKLVLFTGATQTACGTGQAAMASLGSMAALPSTIWLIRPSWPMTKLARLATPTIGTVPE